MTKEERRARRAERRAKQRVANVSRAAKMHAERVASEKEHEKKNPIPSILPQFNVGCSGWFYWHWRGGFYGNLPTKEWFSHYADSFKTVELNAPFYAWPTVATVKSWCHQVRPRKFVYTVKASELITHVKKFSRTKTLIKDFGHIAKILGPNMGCFLFQLPPSFHYTPARLKRILAQLDPAHRNVVEFRHRSWWTKRVFAAFRQAGVIFCSCSGPRLPADLIKTAEEIYIRFHGVKTWYRHDYSLAELEEWAAKVRACGVQRVWAYFNNDRDEFAIKNAQTFLRLLKKRPLRNSH